MRRAVFTVFLLTVAMGGGWLLGQQQPTQPTPLGGLFTGPDVAVRVDVQDATGDPTAPSWFV